MKLIDNKNDLIKISAISRVRKYLKYYEDNPMSNNDKELLAGIFVRQPKEYKEESEPGFGITKSLQNTLTNLRSSAINPLPFNEAHGDEKSYDKIEPFNPEPVEMEPNNEEVVVNQSNTKIVINVWNNLINQSTIQHEEDDERELDSMNELKFSIEH